MKRKNIISLLTLSWAISCLTACTKDLDLDFKEAEPLYVVEAELDNQRTRIAVNKTRSMNSSEAKTGVDGAVITISGSDGSLQTLTRSVNGIYSSTGKGKAGVRYDIVVEVEGQRFTSSSVMQRTPVIKSLRFVWKKMLSTRMLFADLRFDDFSHETNYFFMHLYRNGVGYRWAVLKDNVNSNGELQQLFNCMTEDTDDGDDDKLLDGDNVRMELRAIDKASYDYLHSLQEMGHVASNPIANFSGGCLGYFSAYGKATHSLVFSYADVEEE